MTDLAPLYDPLEIQQYTGYDMKALRSSFIDRQALKLLAERANQKE